MQKVRYGAAGAVSPWGPAQGPQTLHKRSAWPESSVGHSLAWKSGRKCSPCLLSLPCLCLFFLSPTHRKSWLRKPVDPWAAGAEGGGYSRGTVPRGGGTGRGSVGPSARPREPIRSHRVCVAASHCHQNTEATRVTTLASNPRCAQVGTEYHKDVSKQQNGKQKENGQMTLPPQVLCPLSSGSAKLIHSPCQPPGPMVPTRLKRTIKYGLLHWEP